MEENKTNNSQPLNVRIIKDPIPMYKRLLYGTWRGYWKMGKITFGIVLLGNTFTSLIIEDRRNCLFENPIFTFGGILTKSLEFGLFWPAFYVKAVTKPDEMFILGRGIENSLQKWIN